MRRTPKKTLRSPTQTKKRLKRSAEVDTGTLFGGNIGPRWPRSVVAVVVVLVVVSDACSTLFARAQLGMNARSE